MSAQPQVAFSIEQLGRQARMAAGAVAASSTQVRNQALAAAADSLVQGRAALLKENAADLKAAQAGGLDAALLDRLELNADRVEAMATGLRKVATLPDPVGAIEGVVEQPSGIRVGRMRVPLGVIGIIYESRPSVTADAAGLCLKAGNAVLLRGGSEALRSNMAIAEHVRLGLEQAGLPAAAVTVVPSADRALVSAMLAMSAYIDLIVPRGGKGLIERVANEARMPVLKHLDGVCHVYVDDRADLDMAEAIAYNAKTQRYGTCNTMECLLVAQGIAGAFLKRIGPRFKAAEVELRGCPESQRVLPWVRPATEEDYATEYLAPILSVRVVADLDAAMAHIARYGSAHTDTIVTMDHGRAMRFLREVDSSSVMINASTRLADGAEYGLGAEIGISTDRLHARGPVGLEGLTTCKFVVFGNGHVRT